MKKGEVFDEAALVRAYRKLRWGKRDPAASEIADMVKVIQSFLTMDHRRTDEMAMKISEDLRLAQAYLESGGAKRLPQMRSHSKFLRQQMFRTAGALLGSAMSNHNSLHKIADALHADVVPDPRQENLINTYMRCLLNHRSLPTLNEIRTLFVEQFGERAWTGDFNARKTLGYLGLPLRRSRPGRPSGSTSQIGNPKRRGE
jgi:hypothetical protein